MDSIRELFGEALTKPKMQDNGLLYGYNEEIVKFVQQGIGMNTRFDFAQYPVGIGVIKKGELVAGVVYYNYHGFDIEAAIYAGNKSWASKKILYGLFHYPFIKLKCQRMTAITAKQNHKARTLLKKMGFKHEGTHARAYDGYQDAMSYGMMSRDCRWIKKEPY